MSKVVVVLSGGMDSAVLLYHMIDEGHEVRALSVNYGQRHHVELDHARLLCVRAKVPLDVLDLSMLGSYLGKSALVSDAPMPHGHYEDESMKATVVPNRNMVLLSLALARCIALDYDAVAYGAHAGDHAIYPDCRPVFGAAMDLAAQVCDYRGRDILRPFVKMTKTEICSLGDFLMVPFDLTWSCYEGKDVHCGKCGTCVERKEAFQEAGVPDPTVYA